MSKLTGPVCRLCGKETGSDFVCCPACSNAHDAAIREQAKREQMEEVAKEIEAAQSRLRPYESESDYGGYCALRDLHTKLYAAWAKDHPEEKR